MASSPAFGLRGLKLYAGILRAHRALPPQMRALGDSYVREEFKKHRKADAKFLAAFFREWEQYLSQVAKPEGAEGRDLAPEHAGALTPEQKEQLAKLQQEASKLLR